jgi:hypothetical protein
VAGADSRREAFVDILLKDVLARSHQHRPFGTDVSPENDDSFKLE